LIPAAREPRQSDSPAHRVPGLEKPPENRLHIAGEGSGYSQPSNFCSPKTGCCLAAARRNKTVIL